MSRTTPCPQCGAAASLASDNSWRPFCSRRCKLLDLGDWLEERHALPAEGNGAYEFPQAPDSDERH